MHSPGVGNVFCSHIPIQSQVPDKGFLLSCYQILQLSSLSQANSFIPNLHRRHQVCPRLVMKMDYIQKSLFEVQPRQPEQVEVSIEALDEPCPDQSDRRLLRV